MKVTAICATKGRHHLLERSVRLFLEQDGFATLLIFNNSKVPQSLMKEGRQYYLMNDKEIILVNHPLYSVTGKPYENLGQIYRDALKFVPYNSHIITHWDDDDLYLPNHLSAGITGLTNCNLRTNGWERTKNPYLAYKPAKSYFRHADGIDLMSNNLEPSIFVKKEHLQLYQYSNTTTEQHLHWLKPLESNDQIYVDPEGKPTLIYNWGDVEVPTWKTSGDPNNPLNFKNYENFSQDHGDKVITPWDKKDVEKYYKQIEELKQKA